MPEYSADARTPPTSRERLAINPTTTGARRLGLAGTAGSHSPATVSTSWHGAATATTGDFRRSPATTPSAYRRSLVPRHNPGTPSTATCVEQLRAGR